MSKTTKLWLFIAVSLVVVGGLIFGGVMMMLKWDFSLLSTSKHETNEYVITEAFQNISVVTDTADVVFVPTRESEVTVTCQETEKLKYSVRVEDGTLIVELVDERKWYDYIGIHFGSRHVVISLPAREYGALAVELNTGNVDIPGMFRFESMEILSTTGHVTNFASASEQIRIGTSTGDIRVEGVSAGALELTVSTGKVMVTDVTCGGNMKVNVSTGKTSLTDIRCSNLVSNGNAGDLSMKNVVAEGAFSIERCTGDVRLDACDAAEIFIKTDTGDVTGSLLTDKIFLPRTDTGSVDVPGTTTGGKCKVETATGDIKLRIG